MKAANNNGYHYTECGLDNVWLSNGFTIEKTSQGTRVSIKNIEGLHDTIGKFLITEIKNLSGKEIRFLRQELLLSQASLAKLLEVSEQAIHRWENGKSEVNKSAEIIIRLLYCEHLKEKNNTIDKNPPRIRDALKRIADLDDELDQMRSSKIFFDKPKGKEWEEAPTRAA